MQFNCQFTISLEKKTDLPDAGIDIPSSCSMDEEMD